MQVMIMDMNFVDMMWAEFLMEFQVLKFAEEDVKQTKLAIFGLFSQGKKIL